MTPHVARFFPACAHSSEYLSLCIQHASVIAFDIIFISSFDILVSSVVVPVGVLVPEELSVVSDGSLPAAEVSDEVPGTGPAEVPAGVFDELDAEVSDEVPVKGLAVVSTEVSAGIFFELVCEASDEVSVNGLAEVPAGITFELVAEVSDEVPVEGLAMLSSVSDGEFVPT